MTKSITEYFKYEDLIFPTCTYIAYLSRKDPICYSIAVGTLCTLISYGFVNSVKAEEIKEELITINFNTTNSTLEYDYKVKLMGEENII